LLYCWVRSNLRESGEIVLGVNTYVFGKQDGSWVQRAKLTTDDGESNDLFGTEVAVSGDGNTAFIGAWTGTNVGSTYVFNNTNGSWSQQAKLTAEDGDSYDAFGGSVAVSNDGTTALIGAYNDEDPNGVGAGAVYIFDNSSGGWNQQAKLTPDDGDSDDYFGNGVALSSDGTTAVIGAPHDEDPNGSTDQRYGGAGSAYIFDNSDDSWSQQTKLAADDGDSNDSFGWSVAISNDGTTALVSAYADEDPNGAGSSYVFNRGDGSWTQQTKLTADDDDTASRFGRSVGLSGAGSTAIIGSGGDPVGGAYVFDTSDGSWSQRTRLAPENENSLVQFDEPVSISGDGTTALIGALSDDPNGEESGSAYVFE
jgi:hypothetical protein